MTVDVDRGAHVAANRTHALLKQLFDWAAAKDLVPALRWQALSARAGTKARASGC